MKNYCNAQSFLFGLMCLGVVYLHSSWIGGFDIYYIGTESPLIKKLSSLTLMTVVPSFFILWGYLSGKYLLAANSPVAFFKDKILQFYPPYAVSFLVYFIIHKKWEETSGLKTILGLSGIFYESGMGGGGNIYFVVFWIITTISLFKALSLGKNAIYLYGAICLLITKVMPHESGFCFLQYFGYYTAYFVGCAWFFARDFIGNKQTFLICMLGLITPSLNYFGYNFVEIQYKPESPEQLLLCFSILLLLLRLLERNLVYEKNEYFFVRFVNIIGNNVYSHFLIHTHIIYFIILISSTFTIDKIYLQIFTICFTSFFSIYIILPILRKIIPGAASVGRSLLAR